MIPLLRSNLSIKNFFAVNNVKETNLTAYLAYFISAFPDYCGRLFLERGETFQSVEIEQVTDDRDRYDIVFDTNRRLVVFEAKLGFRQFEKQIARYIRHLLRHRKRAVKLYLLDQGSFKANAWLKDIKRALPRRLELGFITWEDVHAVLLELVKYKRARRLNETAYNLANELADYMEANGMDSRARKEVYVRDMSGDSMELFFRYKIYKCQPQFYKSAAGNAYFAPYFTKKAPRDLAERSMIRIDKGISWVAQIRDIQLLKRADIGDYLRSEKHPQAKEATKEILRESTLKELLVFLLGDPFLVFLSPISKSRLNIHGAMGARCFTFAELFYAAGKGD